MEYDQLLWESGALSWKYSPADCLGLGPREFLWTKLDLKGMGGSSCGCVHVWPQLGIFFYLLTYMYTKIFG